MLDDSPNTRTYSPYPEDVHRQLKKWNLGAGILHALQCLVQVILVIAVDKFHDFKLPIYVYHLYLRKEGNAEFLDQTKSKVGEITLGGFIPSFFFLSALFHFLVISKQFNRAYVHQIDTGRNYFRWVEYSISSSIMIWIIAMFFGVYDMMYLISIFLINATMNFCGLMQEMFNDVRDPQKQVNWIPFVVGCLCGVVPWITVYGYLAGTSGDTSNKIPDFVWATLFSYFVFFNTFPINMVLQYKRIGWWADYANGEKGYIILSLASKTLLGWLVFFGLQQPNKY